MSASALAGGFGLRVHNGSGAWIRVVTFGNPGSRPPGPGEKTSETLCLAPHSSAEKTIGISMTGVTVYAAGYDCHTPDRNVGTVRVSGSSGTITISGSGSSITAR